MGQTLGPCFQVEDLGSGRHIPYIFLSFLGLPNLGSKPYIFWIFNRTACIRHQCKKATALSCHRCLINSGVEKNEQHLNID
jgi:hypothetical protein